MHNFRELSIWMKSRELVKYTNTTSQFPKSELYGLTSQMRRASVSIPSNIAEGCGRGTPAQLSHFLDLSYASCCELETQFYLAFDLSFINEQFLKQSLSLTIELQKMIFAFKRKIK